MCAAATRQVGARVCVCVREPQTESKRSESEEKLDEVGRSNRRMHPSYRSLRCHIAKAARRRILENRINVTAANYYTTTSKMNLNKKAVIKCRQRSPQNAPSAGCCRSAECVMSLPEQTFAFKSNRQSKAKQKYFSIHHSFFFYIYIFFFLIALTADTHG